MDEIRRSLDALGLKPGATEAEVKQAYREMAMVWHPDRFPTDSPLQEKAQTKLQEINAAYEFLQAHGFRDGLPIIPEQPIPESAEETQSDSPEPEIIEIERRTTYGITIWGVTVILLAVAGGAWWFITHKKKEPAEDRVITSAPASTNPPQTVAATSNPIPAKPAAETAAAASLLPSMRISGPSAITTSDDGTVLTGDGWLHTRDEYSPPFIIRTVVKTDLTNIRLRYGQGVLIFNWEGNPNELRYHDPVTGQLSTGPGQGHVPPNEWQTIEWRLETNASAISVNGKEIARFPGNHSGLAELAGVQTAAGAKLTVQQFGVSKLPQETKARTFGLNDGLVLYYPFNADENQNVSDFSDFKNHGTVHGATFSKEGKVGGAMSFHGSSTSGDFITVPHSSSLTSMQQTRHLTVCAWIKLRSLPSEYPVILAKGGNFAPKAFGGYELTLRASGGNDLTFDSGKFGVFCLRDRDSWIPGHLNEWIHVAVVVDASAGRARLYLNGERAGDDLVPAQDPRTVNFNVLNNLFIGGPDPSHHPNRAWFDGLIDEVRVYARALSADEIRSLPGFSHAG